MLTEPSWETPSLISLVQSLHETLAGLAEGWLEMGATSFSLWQKDEELLAQWPLACQPICNEPWIVAPVAWGNQSLGELRLTGLTGSSIESRLKAEAALLARIAILEAEMEEVAGELIEKQDTLLALYNLTNSMHSLSLEETLRSLVREASNLTNAQVGMAILSLSGGETLFVQASLEEENLNSGKVFVSQEMALNYFRHFQQDGRERLLNAQNARGRLPEGIENFYFVPISLQNKLVGGLALINRPGGFTSSEAKLVRALSQQGAAQLENVLLYRESLEQARFKTELELAASIQQALLPQHIPVVKGLDIWAGTRAALEVGGDFYDLVIPPGRSFTFNVGDVSGKGVGAALIMAMSRTVLRSAANYTPSPAQILSRVNEDLYDDLTEVGKFVTVFLGQFLPDSQQIIFANAGHSPVIYCPAGRPAVMLEADGTAVGVLPISFSENQLISFLPGDLLVMASDGFSEAINQAGEMFGYEALVQLIQDTSHLSAREIFDCLFDVISNFAAGHPQDDDQTLMVIKRV